MNINKTVYVVRTTFSDEELYGQPLHDLVVADSERDAWLAGENNKHTIDGANGIDHDAEVEVVCQLNTDAASLAEYLTDVAEDD